MLALPTSFKNHFCTDKAIIIEDSSAEYYAVKPEPIMLLVLPIIPSRNSHHYSYFIPMPSPIIPVIFISFCVSDSEVHSIFSYS